MRQIGLRYFMMLYTLHLNNNHNSLSLDDWKNTNTVWRYDGLFKIIQFYTSKRVYLSPSKMLQWNSVKKGLSMWLAPNLLFQFKAPAEFHNSIKIQSDIWSKWHFVKTTVVYQFSPELPCRIGGWRSPSWPWSWRCRDPRHPCSCCMRPRQWGLRRWLSLLSTSEQSRTPCKGRWRRCRTRAGNKSRSFG